MHHNEVRNVTVEQVCRDVEVEPHLQPLNNETFHYKTANIQDGACSAVNSFWGGHF